MRDARFGVSNGIQIAQFDPEAPEFAEAVATAIKPIESTVAGARVANAHRSGTVATAS